VGTEEDCEGEGGVYQDDDSVCEPNPCIEPTPEATPIPIAPVVIIPTMGQWGIIFMSLILGFLAVIALRKRIKS